MIVVDTATARWDAIDTARYVCQNVFEASTMTGSVLAAGNGDLLASRDPNEVCGAGAA